MQILKGHRFPVRRVEFTPDGAELFVAREYHGFEFWDLATGERHQAWDDKGQVTTAVPSRCGRWVYRYTPGTGWAVVPRRPPGDDRPVIGPHPDRAPFRTAMAVPTATGGVVLLAHERYPDGRFECWDVDPDGEHTLRWHRTVRGWWRQSGLTTSPDGTTAAAGLIRIDLGRPDQRLLEFIDLATGRSLRTVPTAAVSTSGLAYTADGGRLIAFGANTVYVWDAADGRLVHQFVPDGRKMPQQVAVHPSGRLVAVACGPAVRFYDPVTWRQGCAFDWDMGDRVLSVGFSRDGLRAAAGSVTGMVVVWDVDG